MEIEEKSKIWGKKKHPNRIWITRTWGWGREWGVERGVASPAAINSGIWFRSHRGSFPSDFSSASRKFFPLTATFYPIEKTSRKDKNPIRLSSNAAQSNIPDDILPVIKYPLGTEYAIKAMLECNTLVFVVDKCADKKNIKDSVEKMFKIRAKKVNTVITPDGTKKAYVMLASDCSVLDVAKRINIL
ncbi:hypothetical protein DH2020_037528 [Rehmannia glutinosa]|uniref:Uncharacterized protein n=1 Tax=Rehmannia glutinosa TaxID=99300 RepID=A0ABR0V135_REHGL